MILSRPQTSTFISFLLFLVFSCLLLGIQLVVIAIDPTAQWFNYLIVVVLIPIVTYVSYRILFQYKKVSMGDRKVIVRYPQFRLTRTYSLEDITYWKETVIKTGKTATYRELEIKFKDGRTLQLGYKEYTEYEKMVKYLGQKLASAKKT